MKNGWGGDQTKWEIKHCSTTTRTFQLVIAQCPSATEQGLRECLEGAPLRKFLRVRAHCKRYGLGLGLRVELHAGELHRGGNHIYGCHIINMYVFIFMYVTYQRAVLRPPRLLAPRASPQQTLLLPRAFPVHVLPPQLHALCMYIDS
jgi:hypothetical protein